MPVSTFPRHLRIALVCDWYLPRVGGIERHLGQLARQLAAAGHEVTVITPTPGRSEDWPRLRVHRFKARLLPLVRLMWTPTAFHRLGSALRNGAFDVVHVHSSIVSPAAYAAIRAARDAGLPVAVTVHSIWGGYWRIFHALDLVTGWTHWPVAFSAVSERVARDMRRVIRPAAIDLVPNAIDPADWRPAPPPASDGITIACVMRLAPRKRGAALLGAFQFVLAQLPPGFRIRLEIAGDGPERPRLERFARNLGLAGAVNFSGAITPDEVKALLARSHFFVLPTRLEAFGIAALEARAAGLPVIALRDSGVSEWLQHEVEGVLASDDEGIAQAMLQLVLDAPRREAMALHNRTTPVAFTWERAVAVHERLYARAMTRCGESPDPVRTLA